MSQPRPHGKALRRLLAEIEKAGWQVSIGRSGHWKVFDPDGRLVATISASASDRFHAHHKVAADLRRAGLDVKVPR